MQAACGRQSHRVHRLRQQQHRRPRRRARGGDKPPHRGQRDDLQPAVRREKRKEAALFPEEDDLDGDADGPETADRGLAVTQRHQVQREKRIQAGVGQHGEEDRRKKPGHGRLAQQRQHRRRAFAGLRLHTRERQPQCGQQQQGVHRVRQKRDVSMPPHSSSTPKLLTATISRPSPRPDAAVTCRVDAARAARRWPAPPRTEVECRRWPGTALMVTPPPHPRAHAKQPQCRQHARGRPGDQFDAAPAVVARPLQATRQTRVHDCSEAMAPMTTVEKPSDWHHSARKD